MPFGPRGPMHPSTGRALLAWRIHWLRQTVAKTGPGHAENRVLGEPRPGHAEKRGLVLDATTTKITLGPQCDQACKPKDLRLHFPVGATSH